MQTIKKENFAEIGTVQKPHGLSGEVILFFDEKFGDTLEEVETLFVEIDGGLVPFFISNDGLRFRANDSAIVQFDEVTTQDEAKELTNCPVFVDNSDLIENVEPTETLSKMLGYTIIDSIRGRLGEVLNIDNFAGNVVVTLNYKSTEILIPIAENIIEKIDDENKEIHINCPEGLIELYFE